MAEAIQILPSLRPFRQIKSDFNPIISFSYQFSNSTIKTVSSMGLNINRWHIRALNSSIEEVDSPPLSIELEQISSETQFDRIIGDAQQIGEPIVLLWMASWCRKCIYLKPKLEKLAAVYHQRVRFYCVDVNAVSHKFVVRAEVTKMPTIQLWKDGKKLAEVIGGHKAHLVVNEVRDMIENEFAM